ncbi:DUF4190 domain-containing protein [Amycolatopsis keratiniphila]|uniref:DUF4190 domain-containing protein n=1 Tax=Amycolatopsis keratiniphila subsp. keratiniphila TaxID=227715 RepID=A0A1W2LFU9_9PSEU|nr:DUF4190 domain-containing protein [Amycolatopsis keratiniphila]ONF61729.1 hypothetical protein AVR91_0242245 [Amycolatopsis keratiniphila subsp. keratiniphila]
MSSSDPQDTPSTSSYTDSNTFSDPTSASSETVSSPAEPQQFQPPAPFTPPPPFEPPAPFEVPSASAPEPAPEPASVPVPDETYGQAIDPLTAEPVPPPYAAPAPPVYTPVPLPAAYPPPQPYNPYAMAAPPRSQDNGMAIAGLVCSLVGICSCVTVIVGLILGHIGLAKANRGEAGGRGIALAAVVIAYIVIALYVGFIGTMIILGVNGELD